MQKYVAFLRAINVGGHTVKMDRLRSLFEALGFKNVETFIASGNVIFDSPSKNTAGLEKKIANHLGEALGYATGVFLRTIPELEEVVSHAPFAEAEISRPGSAVYVGFLADAPQEEATLKVFSLRGEFADFDIKGRELYWLARGRFSESKITGALLEKKLGQPATLRNSTTVRKILSKYT